MYYCPQKQRRLKIWTKGNWTMNQILPAYKLLVPLCYFRINLGFLETAKPTPPLTQHFALGEK